MFLFQIPLFSCRCLTRHKSETNHTQFFFSSYHYAEYENTVANVLYHYFGKGMVVSRKYLCENEREKKHFVYKNGVWKMIFRVITVLVLNNGVWRMGYTFKPNLNF